jgi:hypothetical protein
MTMKLSTKSSYLSQDVFDDLDAAVAEKKMDVVADCVLELTQSGLIKDLLRHTIKRISHDYLTKNAWVLSVIATRLQRISELRFLAKSQEVAMNAFDIFVVLANQARSSVSFDKHGFHDKMTYEDQQCAGEPGEYIQSLHEIDADALQKQLGTETDVLELGNVLCHHMYHGNVRRVGSIVNFIITKSRDRQLKVLWNILRMYIRRGGASGNGEHREIAKRFVASNEFVYTFLLRNKSDLHARQGLLFVNFFLLSRKKDLCWLDENTIIDRGRTYMLAYMKHVAAAAAHAPIAAAPAAAAPAAAAAAPTSRDGTEDSEDGGDESVAEAEPPRRGRRKSRARAGTESGTAAASKAAIDTQSKLNYLMYYSHTTTSGSKAHSRSPTSYCTEHKVVNVV